ncbi:ATP-binding protein p271 [Bathymodiolus heckerae thiotrophic gill symbiont]|uniref:AAA family ATPase n=1 Tax=Bathymodiolus heckerae thiotrophic gill symbiont TaxID=1052212 RepID=UPI0010BA2D45|nr:AAA family ATPase [Bathymodiolus heckerae thiotrophic gill symbiont]SHN91341.1 ATP-binding protein p271 [Bathymodiolus heckerae thiotrophic gill symbiont]
MKTNNTDFLVTKEYRFFEEFCEACKRDKYIGICFGPPGVGKTLSARHYSKWNEIEAIDPFSESSKYWPELADRKTVFYTAPVSNTPKKIDDNLNDGFFKLRAAVYYSNKFKENEMGEENSCELVIVDEADRLTLSSLEHLRDRYDQGNFGLIVIGMPGIEKKMSRYPQFYSRVGFSHPYNPLSEEEMEFVLQHHWEKLGLSLSLEDFTDKEAMASVIRVTAGNFRLVNRLFSQIQRIMKVNTLSSITK